MEALSGPPKGGRLALLGIIVAALFLAAATFFLLRGHFISSRIDSLHLETARLAGAIDLQVIDRLSGAAAAIASAPLVLETARGQRAIDNAETLLILETTRALFPGSIVYVMNSDGLVVACTPYAEGKSLTGNKYSFRPYFVQAMQGRTVMYPAVGVTTLERGIYVSAPILAAGAPVGVLVIKSSVAAIDRMLGGFSNPMALVSPEGVIFASNRPEWLFHSSRRSLAAEDRKLLRESKQFADQPLENLPGGWDLIEGIIEVRGESYAVAVEPVRIAGAQGLYWALVGVNSLAAAYPLPQLIGFAAVVASAVFLFGLILLDRRAYRELRRHAATNREYLAATLESVFEAVITFDLEGRVRHMNPAAERLTGKTSSEAVGKPFVHVCPLLDAGTGQPLADPVGRVVQTGESAAPSELALLVTASGGDRYLRQSVAPIWDQTGAVSGAVMVLTDVTARREAEETLRESETRYRTLFERTANPVLVIDTSGIYIGANEAAVEFFECRRDQLLGKRIHDFLPPGDSAVTLAKLRELWTAGGRIDRDYLIGGAVKTLDLTITPGVWAGRRVVFGVGTDITERKRVAQERLTLERQLQQARKAESLGRMAGAIAHHFNNLLSVVLGNLEMALYDLNVSSRPRNNIVEAMTASRRAAEISRLMLVYLGQVAAERGPLDLSLLVREALPSLRESLPQTANLRVELAEPGPIVQADAAQMRQILTSLVVNAGEALDEGRGEISVIVSVTPGSRIRDAKLQPFGWQPKQEYYACLQVSDTGCGMDHPTMEKLFDPFFSTRFTGRGLGLPVLLGLVKAHEGAVTVESQPGRGAVFRIYLPLETWPEQ
jgi:PAS domain S-box-containing protein